MSKTFNIEVTVTLNGNEVSLNVLGTVEAADRSAGLLESYDIETMHDAETGELVPFVLLSEDEQRAVCDSVESALDRIDRRR